MGAILQYTCIIFRVHGWVVSISTPCFFLGARLFHILLLLGCKLFSFSVLSSGFKCDAFTRSLQVSQFTYCKMVFCISHMITQTCKLLGNLNSSNVATRCSTAFNFASFSRQYLASSSIAAWSSVSRAMKLIVSSSSPSISIKWFWNNSYMCYSNLVKSFLCLTSTCIISMLYGDEWLGSGSDHFTAYDYMILFCHQCMILLYWNGKIISNSPTM